METRIGLNIRRGPAREAVLAIEQAEAAGVGTVWMTQGAVGLDTLGILSAAAMRTERVKLGTSIIPAFTRHPLAMAGQALTLEDIAPGRLRLGIGTSHGASFAAPYGAAFGKPLAQLREYLEVLNPALHDGKVQFKGEFYAVDATLPRPAAVPVLISALRENAWELAGECSDGGISWLCPVSYLLQTAKPAMERGAAKAGRPAPPLVAHIPVAFGNDRPAIRAAFRAGFGVYRRAPFYARMFAAAGYPIEPDGDYPDALLDHLIYSGDETAIAGQLRDLLASGLDELLVMLVPGADQTGEEERLMRLIGEM